MRKINQIISLNSTIIPFNSVRAAISTKCILNYTFRASFSKLIAESGGILRLTLTPRRVMKSIWNSHQKFNKSKISIYCNVFNISKLPLDDDFRFNFKQFLSEIHPSQSVSLLHLYFLFRRKFIFLLLLLYSQFSVQFQLTCTPLSRACFIRKKSIEYLFGIRIVKTLPYLHCDYFIKSMQLNSSFDKKLNCSFKSVKFVCICGRNTLFFPS